MKPGVPLAPLVRDSRKQPQSGDRLRSTGDPASAGDGIIRVVTAVTWRGVAYRIGKREYGPIPLSEWQQINRRAEVV